MSPEDFIRKHIIATLVGEGFPESVARGGRIWSGLFPEKLTGKQERCDFR